MSIIIFSGESSQLANFFKSTCKTDGQAFTVSHIRASHESTNSQQHPRWSKRITLRLCSVKSSSLFLYDICICFADLPPIPQTSISKIRDSTGRNPCSIQVEVLKSASQSFTVDLDFFSIHIMQRVQIHAEEFPNSVHIVPNRKSFSWIYHLQKLVSTRLEIVTNSRSIHNQCNQGTAQILKKSSYYHSKFELMWGKTSTWRVRTKNNWQ